MGAVTYAPDTLLVISIAAFLRRDHNFSVLFVPGERRVLDGYFWCNGKLVLSILDNLQPAFEMLTPSAAGWARAEISITPKNSVANVWRFDAEETASNGDLLANVQDPITPPTLMMQEPSKSWQVLKRAPSTFSTDGLVVRGRSTSVDGVRILTCKWTGEWHR